MERFYKKISSVVDMVEVSGPSVNQPKNVQPQASSNEKNIEIDLENLPSDPGLRPDIMSYLPNVIEYVRRAYLLKGPCQSREYDFPEAIDGSQKRKFVQFCLFNSIVLFCSLCLVPLTLPNWSDLPLFMPKTRQDTRIETPIDSVEKGIAELREDLARQAAQFDKLDKIDRLEKMLLSIMNDKSLTDIIIDVSGTSSESNNPPSAASLPTPTAPCYLHQRRPH
ncbi:hypothetical protein C2S51_021156 [Perilla frutescens var. frutescens]|nr:hypothetical protein C2S51_021156 [Perilla frutescens var. frutescens]